MLRHAAELKMFLIEPRTSEDVGLRSHARLAIVWKLRMSYRDPCQDPVLSTVFNFS